eukprot:27519-Chlamydomonas_euryale.AAC.1
MDLGTALGYSCAPVRDISKHDIEVHKMLPSPRQGIILHRSTRCLLMFSNSSTWESAEQQSCPFVHLP